MPTLIQTRLRCGNTEQLVWLPKDKRVHVNSIISLKGDDRRWTVMNQYEEADTPPQKDWKVGGLK